jgi:hypothetical protein
MGEYTANRDKTAKTSTTTLSSPNASSTAMRLGTTLAKLQKLLKSEFIYS